MLLVDERVGSHDLVTPLQALGLPASLTRLEFGDVAFVGKGVNGVDVLVGVELKKVGDLLDSLRSGRLAGHQLPGLQKMYQHTWLLVEGIWHINRAGRIGCGTMRGKPYGRITIGELNKRLLTLQLLGGLHLWFTAGRPASLSFILALYRFWTDGNLDSHRSHITMYHPEPLKPVSQFQRTISTLPGLGWSLSLAAQKHFGSLARAATAVAAEWATLTTLDARGHTRRLGMATAAKVVTALTHHYERSSYGTENYRESPGHPDESSSSVVDD